MTIEVTTERERMDVAVIHGFLSQSYWAKGIPREVVERSIANSLGFARVITDFATFGYLADVFVLETHRGLGLGKRIMEAVMSHPDLQGLRRWHLVTRDAHGLYAQFGFKALENADRHMGRIRADPY